MQRDDYPMDNQEFAYHPFDRNHEPGLDLRKTAEMMAIYLAQTLVAQGETVTVEPDFDDGDLVFTSLIVRGLTVEGYQTWCKIDGILSEMPAELHIFEAEAVPSGASAPLE